ncbi:MAG: helix-turn-helix domain-containing protein [Coriobacteriaceae bacterium]|nr:helix-turn-helix domain-containing protein [Coriobacteriaceae bacterium]
MDKLDVSGRELRDLGELITPTEFARISKLSLSTVYKLVRDGEVKGRHIGRAIRINRDSARDYLGL